MNFGIFRFVQGILKIRGATDLTLIGNVSDALKVTSLESASFTAYAADVAIGNNKSMLSLVNTSGSTVRVKLQGIAIKNVQTSAVTGVIAEFRLFRIVGHSAGTSITPLPHDTTDSLDSSVTARSGGTVTSEAASYIRRWKWSSDEWGAGSLDVEANDHAQQSLLWIAQPNANVKPFTLNANEGIHIKQVTNSTAGTFDVEFVFVQI